MSGLTGDWLAMDTSTAALTVALMRDGQMTEERSTEAERNHSLRLLPDVQELLAAHGLKAADLSGIAVGRGPGSYTGIRVAVTAAKTLAWSLKLPLIGISSLEALAYGAALRADPGAEMRIWIVPYMDARRGKAYTSLYEWNRGAWRTLEADSIRMLDSWLEEVRHLASPEAEAGRDVARVILAGHPIGHGGVRIIPEDQDMDESPLQAGSVGKLAALYGPDAAIRDAHSFEPNYTQLSEPEKFMPAQR